MWWSIGSIEESKIQHNEAYGNLHHVSNTRGVQANIAYGSRPRDLQTNVVYESITDLRAWVTKYVIDNMLLLFAHKKTNAYCDELQKPYVLSINMTLFHTILN